ncbi:MAG TPA: methyltransferase domain-containing protein [Pyrinomonadaceae bacterium]|nr:methyltransferase domain-containing protein [Pyrinomonadaceae bacterium]
MSNNIYSKVKAIVPTSVKGFLLSRTRRVTDRVARLDRSFIAGKYLAGDGIEIGALHLPLQVPRRARVKYVDRMTTPELRRQYPELASLPLVEPDILDNGEQLANVPDATQDFVIANHFVEHCQNPLHAVGNMLRVLKEGGILYLTIPDMRYTFDVDRPVTSVEHVLRDYDEGPEWSRRQHFEEWVRFVSKVEDATEAEKQVGDLMGMDYSIHFHAWTQGEMFEILAALKKRMGIGFDIELFLKNGAECIFILRKTADN